MKNKIQLIYLPIVFCVMGARLASAQEDAQLVALGQTIDSAIKSGSNATEVASIANTYWQKNFPAFVTTLSLGVPTVVTLRDVSKKYNERAGIELKSDDSEIGSIEDEVSRNVPVYGVGSISSTNTGALRALKGALGISLGGTQGRSLNDLLSVLSNNSTPDASDMIVYRLFMEKKSVIGENIFKQTDEQRKYAPADFDRLAQLAKHPNPVARLIAVEMLEYIPNAKEDATPALTSMMRGMKKENNPAVIKRVVDRANRHRSEVYKEVLPEISKTLEKSNPKLKEEALRVMKVLEEARQE